MPVITIQKSTISKSKQERWEYRNLRDEKCLVHIIEVHVAALYVLVVQVIAYIVKLHNVSHLSSESGMKSP